MTTEELDAIADAANPLLLVVFLVTCVRRFSGFRATGPFLIRFGVALAFTYVVSHLHDWFGLWRSWGDFPSGHMAFLLTVATAFFLLDRRSAFLTIPYALIYGWLIVFLGYHSWFDLAGSAVLAVPVTIICLRVPGGKGMPLQPRVEAVSREPAMPGARSRRSVLFLAGDLSGDTHAARLARRLAERHPDFTLHALGGRQLGGVVAPTGGTWIGDTTNCSAIGLCSVMKIYLWARWLSFKMRRFVRSHRVDVVVLCDWGGFNCRQLNFFNKACVPILYYFPPRSWQRTGTVGLQFASKVRRVATPFEWSAARLAGVGCQADWVGHPLLETMPERGRRERLRVEFGVEKDERLIALLPGSRPSEIRVLAPRLAATVKLLGGGGGWKFVVPVPGPLLEKARRYFPDSVQIVAGRATDALQACDAAVVKMGSATLEAAVMGAPQVAVYDLGWAARIEWMLLWFWQKIPFIAMPNIILQRKAVPELLGLNCKPGIIAEGVRRLLENPDERNAMLEAYGEIRRNLGVDLPFSATERTCEIVEEMLGVFSPERMSGRPGVELASDARS